MPLSDRGRPDFSKAAIKPGAALVNPPRPFLRGTLVAEQEKWKGVLKKALRGLQDPASALTVLGTVAAQERAPLTMELYAAQSAGRKTGGKNHSSKASSATTQPMVLSGALLHSIAFEVK